MKKKTKKTDLQVLVEIAKRNNLLKTPEEKLLAMFLASIKE